MFYLLHLLNNDDKALETHSAAMADLDGRAPKAGRTPHE